MKPNTRSASGRNAKSSRRSGVRIRQERWIRPFRRTHRAIDSTLRLIARSRDLLNECEMVAGVRPRWATRQLRRVSGRLAQASARLRHGAACMCTTHDCVAHSGDALNASKPLIDAMTDWLDAEKQIAVLSRRLDDTSARLDAYIRDGIAPPLDLETLLKKERPAPKRIVFRLPSPMVVSIENNRVFSIHVRRQRSARLTLAEAPRRIFRGRAPPLISICSL
jgi:hypothetical protein